MITIPTLIKLFAMSIVAKRSFGFLRSSRTPSPSLSKSSNSEESKEKYATSAPEIKADETINKIIAKKLNRTSALNSLNSIPLNVDNNKLTGTSSNF